MSPSQNDKQLHEIKTQIKQFEQRVQAHALRGRISGTNDHIRLEQLQKLLAQLEAKDGKSEIKRNDIRNRQRSRNADNDHVLGESGKLTRDS